MKQLLQQKETLALSTGQSSLTATWCWTCNNMGSHLMGVIVRIALCGQITCKESVAILQRQVHAILHTLFPHDVLIFQDTNELHTYWLIN